MAPRKRASAATKGGRGSETFHSWRGEPGWRTLDELFGLGSAILRRIGEIEALMQGVVTSCLDVIAQDVAKARLRLIQETDAGRKVLKPADHPLARRLALDPNEHMSWHEAQEMLVRGLSLHQNAYFVKLRRSMTDTDPDLVPVHPSRVMRQVAEKRFFFDITPGTMGEAAILGFTETRRFSSDDVIHLRGRMHTGEFGLSTLTIGADVFGLNQALIDFQAGMAKNGLRPNAVITTPEALTDEQFARLKKEIEGMLAAAMDSGKPALLEGGTKYEAIAMDAIKGDLVKGRQLLRQEAAAFFRVPAYKVGASESEKYDNKASAEASYVDDTLIPVALRVETSMGRAMLTEKERLSGIRFELSRDDLYDRDRQQASDKTLNQFKAGAIRRNECRTKLGWDPVAPELDCFLVPTNQAVQNVESGEFFVLTSKPQTPDGANDQQPVDEPKKGMRPAEAAA